MILPIEASPDLGEIARGVANSIAATLTRVRTARVVDSSHARYHISGTLRRENRILRLTLRLLAPMAGMLLWAFSYDGYADHLFAFEEHVAEAASVAIANRLLVAEIGRTRKKPVNDLSAHQLALRAFPLVVSLERDAASQAIDLLGESLARQPDQPFAAALASWCHAQRVIYEFTGSPGDERGSALALARSLTVGHGANDPTVLAILGNTYNAIHDLDTADLMINRALALDGSSAWAWGRSGWIAAYRGNASVAIERLSIALRLAPNDPLVASFETGIGCALFQAGRYREAIVWLERALRTRPSAIWVHRVLCPAYVHDGLFDAARGSLTVLRNASPDSSIATVVSALPMTQDFLDRVANGLEHAGLGLK